MKRLNMNYDWRQLTYDRRNGWNIGRKFLADTVYSSR